MNYCLNPAVILSHAIFTAVPKGKEFFLFFTPRNKFREPKSLQSMKVPVSTV